MTEFKDKNFDELATPNTAYCTFMNHEAFQAALCEANDNDKDSFTYWGENLEISRAC